MKEANYYHDIPLTQQDSDNASSEGTVTPSESTLWDYVTPDDDDRAITERAELYEDTFTEMQGEQYFDDDTPQRILEFQRNHRMQRVASVGSYDLQIRLFYQDALFLADVEDSAPIVPFEDYQPTYRAMSRLQLRSYCTFRANFRKGVHLDVSTAYLHLLANELVMLIGVSDAEDAYQQLCEMCGTYTDNNRYRHFRYRCNLWLKDFVVVWTLKEHCNEIFADVIENHNGAVALLTPNDYDDHSVAMALQRFSRYQFLDSTYGKRNSEEMEKVAALVVRHLDRRLVTQSKMSFYQRYVDHRQTQCRNLFMGLLFWQGMPGMPKNASVVIDSMLRFICLNGQWMEDGYHVVGSNARSAELGDITHEVERQVRLFHNDRKLKQRVIGDDAQQAITAALSDYRQALYEARRPKVEVDLTKLNSIRTDASIVRDALLTDEERSEAEGVPNRAAIPAAAQSSSTPPTPTPTFIFPLTPVETQFLTMLLNGQSTTTFLKERHLMASILSESINEKLYDAIGDLVLEDGSHGPEIIEDYRPALITILT